MFNNVGREIKGWAKLLLVLLTIPWIVAGFGVVAMMLEMDEDLMILGLILGLTVAGFGYVLARFSAMFIYAYGQLVETVDAMNETLRSMRPSDSAASSYQPHAEPQTPISIPETNVWFCGTCGERNEGGTLLCKRCNTPR